MEQKRIDTDADSQMHLLIGWSTAIFADYSRVCRTYKFPNPGRRRPTTRGTRTTMEKVGSWLGGAKHS